MTISISSLVIGCGLLFLAGVFTGISIMCMLSVRKNWIYVNTLNTKS